MIPLGVIKNEKILIFFPAFITHKYKNERICLSIFIVLVLQKWYIKIKGFKGINPLIYSKWT
jgi:hypothetical protein